MLKLTKSQSQGLCIDCHIAQFGAHILIMHEDISVCLHASQNVHTATTMCYSRQCVWFVPQVFRQTENRSSLLKLTSLCVVGTFVYNTEDSKL